MYRYIVWEPRSTREIGNYNFLICLGAGRLAPSRLFERRSRKKQKRILRKSRVPEVGNTADTPNFL